MMESEKETRVEGGDPRVVFGVLSSQYHAMVLDNQTLRQLESLHLQVQKEAKQEQALMTAKLNQLTE